MQHDIILLPPDLEQFAIDLAHARNAAADAHGLTDRLVDKRDPLAHKITGARAEIALNLYLGLPNNFDEMAHFAQGCDPGYDAKIGELTIDIKWSTRPNGCLIFRKITKFRAKAAILAVPGLGPSQIKLVGIASRKTFCENYRWIDSLHDGVPFMALDQKFLSPMRVLKNYLRENAKLWKLSQSYL